MTETLAGRRRLGRGLEALLGPTREEAEREGSLVELAIADIRPNPYQPRRDVDPAALEELKASIRKAGLLQPVVVRPAPSATGGGGCRRARSLARRERAPVAQAPGSGARAAARGPALGVSRTRAARARGRAPGDGARQGGRRPRALGA